VSRTDSNAVLGVHEKGAIRSQIIYDNALVVVHQALRLERNYCDYLTGGSAIPELHATGCKPPCAHSPSLPETEALKKAKVHAGDANGGGLVRARCAAPEAPWAARAALLSVAC
jgi:hypothetical protein